MTRPRGFEPLTFGSVDRRSIQLSYGRTPTRVVGDAVNSMMEALVSVIDRGGVTDAWPAKHVGVDSCVPARKLCEGLGQL